MSKRIKVLLGLGLLAILAVGAFLAVPRFLGLDSNGPPELAIGDRGAESIAAIFVVEGEEAADDNAETDSEPETEAASVAQLETIEGVWEIAGDSVAGYRVFKDFVGASEFEAVGRTQAVFGDLTIEGTSVTEATFNVDVATIVIDDDRRDREFRGPVLNAAVFPFASFSLTSPIDLGESANSGDDVTVNATGEVTLKGVTNEVTVPLTARLVGDEVQVAGAIDIVFADYGIEPPTTPAIIVRDEGIIEFSLFFQMS